MSERGDEGDDDEGDAEDIEEERHRLEALARRGDRSALLDLAHLAIQIAGDDDEDQLRAGAKLVRDAIAKCRDDEQLVLEAWELVPESIVNFARAWPEEETVAAAERDLGRDDPVTSLVRGLLAFYAGRWKDAEEALRDVDDDAVAAHYLGCALERLGRDEEADEELARAADLDPERFVEPVRMAETEFKKCLEEAYGELPEPVRALVDRTGEIIVEDFPRQSDVEAGSDPLKLGEYRGADLGASLAHPFSVETSIADAMREVILFKKNLEKVCATRDELLEQIHVTIYHEIGHAYGLDEEGVDDLGLA